MSSILQLSSYHHKVDILCGHRSSAPCVTRTRKVSFPALRSSYTTPIRRISIIMEKQQDVEANSHKNAAVADQQQQPWYTAFPEPLSKAEPITAVETLGMLKSSSAHSGSTPRFILIDLRRLDYEVSGCVHIEFLFIARASMASSIKDRTNSDHHYHYPHHQQQQQQQLILLMQGGTIYGSINLPAQSLYPTIPSLYRLFKAADVRSVIWYCG